MKLSDGLFLESCGQVAADYDGRIEFEDRIVDNMCMQLVQKPELYDVLVLPNLYGDIVSDLAAGLVGGLGVAPGANIGEKAAVFEPVHGSAPKYAGQNKANPTALILSGALMLRHLGETGGGRAVEAAVREVIAEGATVTYDLGGTAGTREFGEAVAARVRRCAELPLDRPRRGARLVAFCATASWAQLAWFGHRAGGIGVLVYLFLHIVETSTVLFGPGRLRRRVGFFRNLPARLGEILLMAALVYHALNGLRVILMDFWPAADRLLPAADLRRDRRHGGGHDPAGADHAPPRSRRGAMRRPMSTVRRARVIYANPSRAARPKPEASGRERFWWCFMRLSGLALVILALGHMFIMHVLVELTGQEIDFAFVRAGGGRRSGGSTTCCCWSWPSSTGRTARGS